MECQQLTGVFGAEVRGIDLSRPLDDEQAEAFKTALHRYKVLVLRDQIGVGPADLLAAAGLFGTPEAEEHFMHKGLPDYPAVKQINLELSEIPDPKESWHTDGATRTNTRAVTFLQAIDVPPFGRDTAFADMEAIFESLSPRLQTLLEGLTATHAYGPRAAHVPPVDHPVVRVNPVTGRKAIYVTQLYTTRIHGLKQDESDALLQMLFAKPRLLEFQLRVSWRPGTIVVWDNEVTQHYLVLDKAYHRKMHRVMAL